MTNSDIYKTLPPEEQEHIRDELAKTDMTLEDWLEIYIGEEHNYPKNRG